jgi:hypothetical protein
MHRDDAPLARSFAARAAALRLGARIYCGISQQHRRAVPWEGDPFRCGVRVGKNGWRSLEPIVAGTLASFLGGTCVFWLGRRLGHARLERIHWLHLTEQRLEWPERLFKRHGETLQSFFPALHFTCGLDARFQRHHQVSQGLPNHPRYRASDE